MWPMHLSGSHQDVESPSLYTALNKVPSRMCGTQAQVVLMAFFKISVFVTLILDS